MAEFSSSFTGKGVTARLEGSTTQSYAGLGDTIKEIENIRYETFQKNRAEFLKNANVDPAFVLSNAARETQMKLIDNFNKKYGKLAQQKNYNLSTEDRLNMQTERNLIEAVKNEQLGQYELFKQHRDLVAKNPNRYDLDKFNEATDSYLNSGRYDQTMPALKSMPFGLFIREQAKKVTGEYDPRRVVSGNQVAVATRNVQDIGKFIEDNLFVNDQATLGMLEDWGKQPPQEKAKWLEDIDKSGTIDQAEQENGIIKWAKQFYAKDAEVISYSPWKNIDSGRGRSSSAVRLGGMDIKLTPGVQRNGDVTYGGVIYSRPYSFGSSQALVNVPIAGAKKHRGTITTKMVTDKGSIRAQLLEYDPDKDVLIVRSVTSNNALGLDSQDVVEVPASNLEGVDNIPIMIGDRQATIGELRSQRKTQTTTQKTNSSGLVWKK